MPADILLATLNAKFIHAAFGLRYLLANLGELRPRAALAEFDINQRPVDIAETILALDPRIVGLGVYIWNVALTTELVAILKRARPELIIILGGPEVSFETDQQEIVRLADHVITGEADLKFAEVCRALLSPVAADVRRPTHSPRSVSGAEMLEPPHVGCYGSPLPKIIPAELPDLTRLELPYELYDERDAAHRVIYVEVSRGCPFTCEFCLSSLDVPVRQFPLDRFLAAMQRLLDRGVTQFKFVDRTFNLHLPTSSAILRFFLERWRPGLFVHFEMVPDRLPEPLRELIAQFPPGALQFEVGIQTFNPEVEQRISRRQNHDRLDDNLRWLRAHSGVHVHADLIAGLPGESLESFGAGFDRLLALRPQEIQVGILKRLRGTPIIRHDREWGMVYNPQPPYEVLQTKQLDFATLGRLRRFARFWDLFGNSGNFTETLPLLWTASQVGQVSNLSGESSASPTVTETDATGETVAAGMAFKSCDLTQPVSIHQRHLPHWQQAGGTYFVTFRLADSVPQELLRRWQAELAVWERAHPEPITDEARREYRTLFPRRFQTWLDQGLGSCLLREPPAAECVEQALRHFDGQRYFLGSFVVMPNHVHVLVTPIGSWSLGQILHSWKRHTALELNRQFHRVGSLWQDESFDHLVRNETQLARFERYLKANPVRAKLTAGQFHLGIGQAGRGVTTRNDGPDRLETCPTSASPFRVFLRFSDWLHAAGVKTSGIAQMRQYELLWKYLTEELASAGEAAGPALRRDYERSGRRDTPNWLAAAAATESATAAPRSPLPKRQARHLARP